MQIPELDQRMKMLFECMQLAPVKFVIPTGYSAIESQIRNRKKQRSYFCINRILNSRPVPVPDALLGPVPVLAQSDKLCDKAVFHRLKSYAVSPMSTDRAYLAWPPAGL